MNIRVMATVWDDDVYKQMVDSTDVIGILMRLHDSNINDKSEFAKLQREELSFAIDKLRHRRTQRP